jgi:hypothetical protein
MCSVSIVTRLWVGIWGLIPSNAVKGLFLLAIDHICFGAHQTYPMGTGDPSLGVKQLGHEDEHLRLSSMKVNVWSYTSTFPYIFMGWLN